MQTGFHSRERTLSRNGTIVLSVMSMRLFLGECLCVCASQCCICAFLQLRMRSASKRLGQEALNGNVMTEAVDSVFP